MWYWPLLATHSDLVRARSELGFIPLRCDQATSAADVRLRTKVGSDHTEVDLAQAVGVFARTKADSGRRHCASKAFSSIAYCAAGGTGSLAAGMGPCLCHLRAIGDGFVLVVVSTPAVQQAPSSGPE